MSSPLPFRCSKKKCKQYFATIGELALHYTEAHTKPSPRKKFKLDDELPPKDLQLVRSEKLSMRPTAEQRKQMRAFIEDGKAYREKRKTRL